MFQANQRFPFSGRTMPLQGKFDEMTSLDDSGKAAIVPTVLNESRKGAMASPFQHVRILAGDKFATPFEKGCIALTDSDANGDFLALDSDSVEVSCNTVMVVWFERKG